MADLNPHDDRTPTTWADVAYIAVVGVVFVAVVLICCGAVSRG